jgi:hypothetical protein
MVNPEVVATLTTVMLATSNRFAVFVTCTHILTRDTGYWSIFILCIKCHVYFSTFVFANESGFFMCRVLSFICYWFGMVQRKLTIPNAKLPQSAPAVLNGRCNARMGMSRSSLGVVLRGLPARGRSVTFPVWRKRCISRTMMKWSAILLWLKLGPAHIQTGSATAIQYSWCTSW